MERLPARPDLDHLKKQARQLLVDQRRGDPAALLRFREHLPTVRGLADAAIAASPLRLHDAQSCVAREYGFRSWAELAGFVAIRRAKAADPRSALLAWLRFAYAGDVAGGMDRSRPVLAARLLSELPRRAFDDDPYLACAIGDVEAMRRALAADAGWLHRAGGPLRLPPLIAVTHSGLLRHDDFRDRLRDGARWLLDAGADPNQRIGSRWPPASLEQPSDTDRLSALYGAAGQHHDVVLTQMLLDAGADPNDGESLYHAVDDAECTRRLLAAGARPAGTNALHRVLDLDATESLRLLLAHGADPNGDAPNGDAAGDVASGEAGPGLMRPLLWAIRRRRSVEQIGLLLDAGADPAVRTAEGIDAATLARRYGLPQVAALIDARRVARGSGGSSATASIPAPVPADAHAADATPASTSASTSASAPPTDVAEALLAACAVGDEARARELLARAPDAIAALSPSQRRMLPELAALGQLSAVACMVRLGWPIDTPGGDWQASALNQAVFRGDAAMTRLLLEHGASWTERHGFGDDCSGTLSWASSNAPQVPSADGAAQRDDGRAAGEGRPAADRQGDWLGCARALVAHGMPGARPDPDDPDGVLLDGRRKRFSEEVTLWLLEAGISRTR